MTNQDRPRGRRRRSAAGVQEQKPQTQTLPAENREKQRTSPKRDRSAESKVYSAPCSVCGKEAVLKYKPTGLIPIFCPSCFEETLNAKIAGTDADVLRQLKTKRDTYEPVVSRAIATPKPEMEASFADFRLDSRLERAIAEAGFEIPTPVQKATIPILLDGRDVIGTAQTGTGKTAAFVLPILQYLLGNPSKNPHTRAIVLTPTRELAEQIHDAFRQLGRHTRIRCATVYGGVGMAPQEKALTHGTEIIVACPGRLLDHMERGNTNFSGLEKLVLDEADRMLDMGFLPSIKRILAELPRQRQSMLFSATFADELMQLASETLNDPLRVDVDICAPPSTIAHALYPCPQHLKTSLVLRLLDVTHMDSVLIFTRTKHRANRVAQQIERAGYKTGVLHSNKSQNQRQSALEDFRAGRCQVLVATDIAARGLDVEGISHVINYDIPDTADTYIHRIGRTGRAERDGDAFTLVTTEDTAIVWDIEKALGAPIDRRKLEGFDYNAPAPERTDSGSRMPRGRAKSVEATETPKSDKPARSRGRGGRQTEKPSAPQASVETSAAEDARPKRSRRRRSKSDAGQGQANAQVSPAVDRAAESRSDLPSEQKSGRPSRRRGRKPTKEEQAMADLIPPVFLRKPRARRPKPDSS